MTKIKFSSGDIDLEDDGNTNPVLPNRLQSNVRYKTCIYLGIRKGDYA